MGFNSGFKALMKLWVPQKFGKILFQLDKYYFERKPLKDLFRGVHYKERPLVSLHMLAYIHILYSVFNLKVDRILIWVIYLLRITTYYITQLTCIYSKCWKWCPFISMHLSARFTMFFATILSVLSFLNHFRNSTFYCRLPSKFFEETLSTVGVKHRF